MLVFRGVNSVVSQVSGDDSRSEHTIRWQSHAMKVPLEGT